MQTSCCIIPIRARLASQDDELWKKPTRFRKAEHRGATIMYSVRKIMCFFNLKLHKHIALQHIHKIMFFLATSYDPVKVLEWSSQSPDFNPIENM